MPKSPSDRSSSVPLKTYPAFIDETHNASFVDELLRTNKEEILCVNYLV